MHHLPTALRRWFTRATDKPVSDRANAELARQLLKELEDEQLPSPLLLNLATGFPSALLCVLAAGVLAGVLAGREVSAPLLSADRQAQLEAIEDQALLAVPQRDSPSPAPDTRQR